MAKQAVGAVERHVEKGILALALMCLIYVVVTYLLTSPNRLTLSRGGEAVLPNRIDQLVADEAERVRRTISDRPPEPKPIPDPLPDFEEAIDLLAYAKLSPELPRAVAFHPLVPMVGPKVWAPGSIKLVEVVKLPKPVVTTGRSTLELVVKPLDFHVQFNEVNFNMMERYPFPFAVNWVTVSSVFDVGEQTRLQREAYQPGYEEPILAGIEAQRRARRPDGSWVDDDWEDLETYEQAVLAPPPVIRLETNSRGEQRTHVDSLDDIEDMQILLGRAAWVRVNLLRPLMPVPQDGDEWSWPQIAGCNAPIQDTLILFPHAPLNPADPYMRYVTKLVEDVTVRNRDDISPDLLDPAKCRGFITKTWEAFVKAFALENRDTQNKLYNELFPCLKFPEKFDGACVNLAKKRMTEIRKLQGDWDAKIEIWEKANVKNKALRLAPLPRPSPSDVLGGQDRAPGPGPVVTTSNVQQVWVHDARLGSVQGGGIYQYRMRAVLLNLYAGQPKQLDEEADAAKWFIYGDWSEPTDPEYIEPEARFFVRTGNEKRGYVSVDVYKWYKGVWIRSTFKVGVGDPVGGEARTQGPDEENPTPLVDFATGCTVVDVDFHRPIRSRDRAGRSGVKYTKADDTVALVVMDESGRVWERLASIDRYDPVVAKLRARLYKPKPKPREPKPFPGPRPGPGP